MQRYSAAGLAVGSLDRLRGQSGYYADNALQARKLSDGGYVLSWVGATATQGTDIFAQRYTNAGVKVGASPLQLSGEAGAMNDSLADAGRLGVTPLANGGYLVAWSGDITSNSSDVFVARYDASNTLVGRVQLEQAPGSLDRLPSVHAFADGS